MQVEAIPKWQFSPADETEIAGLLARCFPTDFSGRSFFQQRHHLRLVIRAQGRIVGHMALLFRAIRLGETLVNIAGLAEVATDPTRDPLMLPLRDAPWRADPVDLLGTVF